MLEGQVPRPGPDFPGVKLQRLAVQWWREAPARSASAGALEVRGRLVFAARRHRKVTLHSAFVGGAQRSRRTWRRFRSALDLLEPNSAVQRGSQTRIKQSGYVVRPTTCPVSVQSRCRGRCGGDVAHAPELGAKRIGMQLLKAGSAAMPPVAARLRTVYRSISPEMPR